MAMRGINRARANPALALIFTGLVYLLLGASPLALAEGASSAPLAFSRSGGLDNTRFAGPFIVEGEKDPPDEIFTFKNGKFHSASCLEWGFTPAPYWTRRDADGLHFLAELESPEHGTMRYQGVFDGKKLKATALWRKERWYWTLERVYRGDMTKVDTKVGN